jgi:hypothetical protein
VAAEHPVTADGVADRQAERQVPRVEQQPGEHRGRRAAAGGGDADSEELRATGEDEQRHRGRLQDRRPRRDGDRAEGQADDEARGGEGSDVLRQARR